MTIPPAGVSRQGFRQERNSDGSVLRVTSRATQEASTSKPTGMGAASAHARVPQPHLGLGVHGEAQQPVVHLHGHKRKLQASRGSASAEGWPDRRGPGREAETLSSTRFSQVGRQPGFSGTPREKMPKRLSERPQNCLYPSQEACKL